MELERNFAKHYSLPASGSLRLTGDRRVRYAGQVLAPEYFIVTAPGADFGAEANFAVVFGSLRTAQLLTGQRGSVNELVLRLHRGADIATVRSELQRSLRRILPGPEGIRFIAIGGAPGAFTPGAWTELGADPPAPPAG